jgi:hypothetical protein
VPVVICRLQIVAEAGPDKKTEIRLHELGIAFYRGWPEPVKPSRPEV